MSKYVYHWEAVLKDNTVIQQFDQHGQEHQFKEVQEHMDELVFFFIRSAHNEVCVGVDLAAGSILISGVQDVVLDKASKSNIRLVYFRRVRAVCTEKMEGLGRQLWQIVGFQYTDGEGRNHKCLAQVDDNGHILIEA